MGLLDGIVSGAKRAAERAVEGVVRDVVVKPVEGAVRETGRAAERGVREKAREATRPNPQEPKKEAGPAEKSMLEQGQDAVGGAWDAIKRKHEDGLKNPPPNKQDPSYSGDASDVLPKASQLLADNKGDVVSQPAQTAPVQVAAAAMKFDAPQV
ncbi:MAG: hypothetical protein KDJ26_06305 [Alphaproteobacteria bacterium]|nr:hypothetical protein [Alphaproteobacteria bacterium]MCB9984834.1 hypothetical protein [Micavibrio sp.]HPQ51105.1 hypothetical protein [Alphaproteobacteria bacterium]